MMRAALLTMFCVLALLPSMHAHAYKVPKMLPAGWDGTLELSGQANLGVSRTSSVSANTSITYRSIRWENRLVVKALRNASTTRKDVKDDEGRLVLDDNGEQVTKLVRKRTSDRRFVSFEPRLYIDRRVYLFTISDYETNPPIGIEHTNRVIGGLGYRVWKSRRDYLTAGVGVGNKHQRLQAKNDEADIHTDSRIGYIGLNFVTDLSERVRFSAELDADLGADERVSELEFGLTWKLRDPLSLKFKYATRMNGSLSDVFHPLDPDVDARATVSLEIDVF